MFQAHSNVGEMKHIQKKENLNREFTDELPEYIVSPAIHVTQIPSELAPDQAAPLLCGMFDVFLGLQT